MDRKKSKAEKHTECYRAHLRVTMLKIVTIERWMQEISTDGNKQLSITNYCSGKKSRNTQSNQYNIPPIRLLKINIINHLPEIGQTSHIH